MWNTELQSLFCRKAIKQNIPPTPRVLHIKGFWALDACNPNGSLRKNLVKDTIKKNVPDKSTKQDVSASLQILHNSDFGMITRWLQSNLYFSRETILKKMLTFYFKLHDTWLIDTFDSVLNIVVVRRQVCTGWLQPNYRTLPRTILQ